MTHESGATEAAYANAHGIARVLSYSAEFSQDHDLVVDRTDGSVTISMWPADVDEVIVAHVNADGVMTELTSRETGSDGEAEGLRGSTLWEDIVEEGIPAAE